MPRLSSIIVAMENHDGLEASLVSVLENRPEQCEIIVVLNSDYSDPYDLKEEVRFVQLPRSSGRTACINAAVAETSAPVVHLLAAGLEVGPGWADAALEHFAEPRVAAVAPLIVDREDHLNVLAAGFRYTAGGRRLINMQAATDSGAAPQIDGPLAAAAFYRKSSLEAVGGFPLAVGNRLADVDVALALAQLGMTTDLEPRSKAYAHQVPYSQVGGFRYGLEAQRVFWRNIPARGWTRSLALHSGSVMRDAMACQSMISAGAQLFGRFMASLALGSYVRNHGRLKGLAAQAAEHVEVPRAQNKGLRFDSAHATVRANEVGVRVSRK